MADLYNRWVYNLFYNQLVKYVVNTTNPTCCDATASATDSAADAGAPDRKLIDKPNVGGICKSIECPSDGVRLKGAKSCPEGGAKS
jgi:hypothetical protein